MNERKLTVYPLGKTIVASENRISLIHFVCSKDVNYDLKYNIYVHLDCRKEYI